MTLVSHRIPIGNFGFPDRFMVQVYRSKSTGSHDRKNGYKVHTNFYNRKESEDQQITSSDDSDENHSIKSDESEDDSDDEFHPELFGLLDDPGVLRVEDVDYPPEIMNHNEPNTSTMSERSWIRVSSDNISDILCVDIKPAKTLLEQNFISRSLNNLHLYSSDSNDRSSANLLSRRKPF